MDTIAKKTFDFGKINLYGTGRRYPASVTIELRKRGGEETFRLVNGERVYTGEKTPEYYEFSAMGAIYNTTKTDWISGGQNLDEIAKYVKSPLFREIYTIWKNYHLNGMYAGTPEQEKAISEWKNQGNRYDYTAACEYLKSVGLYEVNYTGKATGRIYKNEPYKYGHGWLIQDLPEEVITKVKELCEA